MATRPSVKGTVFSIAIEDVNKLLANGELSRERATRWLEDADIALLSQPISVSAWYDVRSYDRLSCLLRDVEGQGRNEYLREKGRNTARRLLEAGMYSQLEYLQRTQVAEKTDAEERFVAFGRDLNRLATLSGSILNFSSWKSRPDPARAMRYVLEVSDAKDVPETLSWRSDGFVNEMASHHAANDLWIWRRERPDLIVFRMTREI